MNFQSDMTYNVCSYSIMDEFWDELPEVNFNQYCLDAPVWIPAGSTKPGIFGGIIQSDIPR